MKRIGYVIEQIVEQSNLDNSFDTVLRGNHRKRLKEGKWLLAHRQEFLDKLRVNILKADLSSYMRFHPKLVFEGAKWRNIQVFPMSARIAINAVMSVVDRHLKRRFIRTTGASIKGRGLHDLKHYIERDIATDPQGTRYVYKFDIRKFYESVKQDYIKFCVRRVFKDKRLVKLLDDFVSLLDTGISMGMRSSQGLGNLLLSTYLDHYLKERFGVRYYYRYCDDGVVLASDKRTLWRIRDKVHECASRCELNIKESESVFPIEQGIDFLGFVIYPTHSRLRKRVKKAFARKLKRVKSRKRRVELIGSLYGLAKHGNCRNLLKKLLTRKEMNKFSELGVTYTPPDGKKRFLGKTVRLGSIVNSRIEIHDYERDIKTAHGSDRYVVQFRYPDTHEYGKFFTASEEMKSILDQIAEKDAFPFETIIRSECFDGNKYKYIFT